MEVDSRHWGPVGEAAHRERHYLEGEGGGWAAQQGLDMNGKGLSYPHYPRGLDGYHSAALPDRPTYYSDLPAHTLPAPDMTSSCDAGYQGGQLGAPSHGMFDMLPGQHYPAGPSADMDHWHMQMLSQADPLFLPLRDGPSKRKRRRVISMDQRKAANIRERRRMYCLNESFDDLRKRVPTFAYEKKLSRIETLKLAVTYIQFMGDILQNNGEKCKELLKSGQDKSSLDSDDSCASDTRDLSPGDHKTPDTDTSFGGNTDTDTGYGRTPETDTSFGRTPDTDTSYSKCDMSALSNCDDNDTSVDL